MKTLIEYRSLAGMRVADVARTLTWQRQTVSRLERSANPTLKSMQEYLGALGMELVVVPREMAPEVERMASNGGVVGPTNFVSALDELLGV